MALKKGTVALGRGTLNITASFPMNSGAETPQDASLCQILA